MREKDIAIRVSHLGKRYKIGHRQPYRTFADTITNVVTAPFRRFGGSRGVSSALDPSSPEEFWALKDVSFDVMQGEVVGIVGRNGAGKSTLLKILSRITTPTEGEVEIHGRVGSLLEVGTGFHPEMTGRENIFLNGSILGMKKVEIEQKFDDIVKFADIEKFIDTPVKRYSSGMYVRLAFAVAAHLEPEILVVDEVLAVGDAQFQKKCLGKMGEIAKEGRTVLFVSHNMEAMRKLCTRCIHIDKGKIKENGGTECIIDSYLDSSRCEISAEFHPPQKKDDLIIVYKTVLERVNGVPSSSFKVGESWQIRIFFRFDKEVKSVAFGLAVQKNKFNVMATYSQPKTFSAGEYQVVFRNNDIFLVPSIYTLFLKVRSHGNVIATYDNIGTFEIIDLTSGLDNLYKINIGMIVNPMETIFYDNG